MDTEIKRTNIYKYSNYGTDCPNCKNYIAWSTKENEDEREKVYCERCKKYYLINFNE